ncbi:hypothetical protein [Mycobacterium sherrisii]|uniref:Uncharacterized protein n=1 Tax=Mycobacterium sherrisii TaxID=243061 RepID=A0A1E3S467_9MYCO|nr:hypothetical protein [Mycobacterium sherrisii]MCV7032208.1 hypothetical protein [Mycobacterium sherrisii]ODQ96900.1 hypothetical protein BHQ21_26400 [Mycobacterium sherrisii]
MTGSGQTQLDLGLEERSAAEPLPITSSKSALLWEALCAAYAHMGFDKATAVTALTEIPH